MMNKILYIITFCLLFNSCQKKETGTAQNVDKKNINQERSKTEMLITSSSFKEGGMIPAKYTCDGENISPPLEWSQIPEGTKSFALISDDPDAPAGDWVHWVLYNLPPSVTSLVENILKEKTLENGAKQGINDFRKTGYDGPCPPGGTHRYFFKLFALDTMLEEKENMTKSDLLNVMKGHILSNAQLIGKYSRK